METIKLDKDISVFYVTAKSYPEGILDAHQALHNLVPFSKDRRYFGLSRPENNQGIVYKACAEELQTGEAEKFGCDTMLIKKGDYICVRVEHFRQDPQSIGSAFQELLSFPHIDPQGYCVEWYENEKEEVKCMIRLDA